VSFVVRALKALTTEDTKVHKGGAVGKLGLGAGEEIARGKKERP
jgi:hypothetical protein